METNSENQELFNLIDKALEENPNFIHAYIRYIRKQLSEKTEAYKETQVRLKSAIIHQYSEIKGAKDLPKHGVYLIYENNILLYVGTTTSEKRSVKNRLMNYSRYNEKAKTVKGMTGGIFEWNACIDILKKCYNSKEEYETASSSWTVKIVKADDIKQSLEMEKLLIFLLVPEYNSEWNSIIETRNLKKRGLDELRPWFGIKQKDLKKMTFKELNSICRTKNLEKV